MATTSDLELLRQTLIVKVNLLFHEFSSNQASRLTIEPPPVPEIVKLKAPQDALYTSSVIWREHIKKLHPALLKCFGSSQFQGKDLRAFMLKHVELLPGDYQSQGSRQARWHQSLLDAINCRTHVWGKSGPVLTWQSHNRWKVEPLP
jgi:hypothetical protein